MPLMKMEMRFRDKHLVVIGMSKSPLLGKVVCPALICVSQVGFVAFLFKELRWLQQEKPSALLACPARNLPRNWRRGNSLFLWAKHWMMLASRKLSCSTTTTIRSPWIDLYSRKGKPCSNCPTKNHLIIPK